MSVLEWAKREVEIACKRERENSTKDEWNHGCECYLSALRAFKTLCEDGHTGMSISITKSILNKLIDGKALTPIEDTPEVWEEVTFKNDYKTYQCKRMSSLFKDVYPNGTVIYNDINRAHLYDGHYWHSGKVDKIVNEVYPIKMPYVPLDKPIVVYGDNYDSVNNEVGIYDHSAYYYLIHPNGERKEINKFIKETINGDIEITKEEYEISRPNIAV